MAQSSSNGVKFLAAAAGIVALLAAVLAIHPAGAAAEKANCNLLSPGAMKSVVGLAKVANQRAVSDSTAGIHTDCDFVLWSGSTPTSPAGVLAKGKSGKGAQIGYSTWTPGGEHTEAWVPKGFEEKLNEFSRARFAAVTNLPGKVKALSPKSEGHPGGGATIKLSGVGKGLETAVGCWWNVNTTTIICLFDEEATGKPVVAHLNALAAKAVPGFLN
jgi:hypothetical protein